MVGQGATLKARVARSALIHEASLLAARQSARCVNDEVGTLQRGTPAAGTMQLLKATPIGAVALFARSPNVLHSASQRLVAR